MRSQYRALVGGVNNILSIRDYEISSQGVSKLQETIFEWPIKKGYTYTDHKLQNIWLRRINSSKIYCLRAGGVDQEIIDFEAPSEPSKNYYVMDIGPGRSAICWFSGDTFCEVIFDENGYIYEQLTVDEFMDEIDTKFPKLNVQKLPSDFNLFDDTHRISTKQSMHPESTFIPLGTYGDQYLIWDFHDGFKNIDMVEDQQPHSYDRKIEAQEFWSKHLCHNIPLPGNNHTYHNGEYWGFSSDAVQFDTGIMGIIPIGDETPKPRFPMTLSEKNFQEETRKDIEMIKGFLSESEEWQKMFGNR